MASSVIHMCVAKEINKYLNRDEKQILIGTIAPDISKIINESKEKSHFLNDITNDILILADIIYNSIRDKEGTQRGAEEKYIVYTQQYMRDGFFVELLEELNKHLDKKINQFDFIRAIGIECENAEVWRTIRKKQYSNESKLAYYDEEGKVVYINKKDKKVKTIKSDLQEIITNNWKNIIKEQISNLAL